MAFLLLILSTISAIRFVPLLITLALFSGLVLFNIYFGSYVIKFLNQKFIKGKGLNLLIYNYDHIKSWLLLYKKRYTSFKLYIRRSIIKSLINFSFNVLKLIFFFIWLSLITFIYLSGSWDEWSWDYWFLFQLLVLFVLLSEILIFTFYIVIDQWINIFSYFNIAWKNINRLGINLFLKKLLLVILYGMDNNVYNFNWKNANISKVIDKIWLNIQYYQNNIQYTNGFFFKLSSARISELGIVDYKWLWNKEFQQDLGGAFLYSDKSLNFVYYNSLGFDKLDEWNLTYWHLLGKSPLPFSLGIISASFLSYLANIIMYSWSRFINIIPFQLDLLYIDWHILVSFWWLYILFFFICYAIILWGFMVFKEAYLAWEHNYFVDWGMRWAWLLFIISEIMLFSGFFGGYFYTIFLGWFKKSILNIKLYLIDECYLYKGYNNNDLHIGGLDPFTLPLINTLLLFGSGIIVTRIISILKLIQLDNAQDFNNMYSKLHHNMWSHFSSFILYNNKWYSLWTKFTKNLLNIHFYKFKFNFNYYSKLFGIFTNVSYLYLFAIYLGLIFVSLQYEEYKRLVTFALFDGIFPSYFYMITGLHGLHVFIGILFLLESLAWYKYLINAHTFSSHLNGIVLYISLTSFELPSWYWHFVDIVWCFVWLTLYQVPAIAIFDIIVIILNNLQLLFSCFIACLGSKYTLGL